MSAVEDRLAIRGLIEAAMILIDLRDHDGYGALFAPNGLDESAFGQAQGPRDISAMNRRLTESGVIAGKRHFTGPILIELDGDRARALSHYWVAETAGPSAVVETGTFSDELQKMNGAWRFVQRRQTDDHPSRR
jgi:hypothetical protein